MADALTPTSSDVLAARELMLNRLRNGGTVDARRLQELLCRQVGVSPHTARGEELQITGRGEEATADLTSALIVRARLSMAVAEAIAELRAHGLITAVVGHEQPNVSISVHHYGSHSGASFSMPPPEAQGTYRLLRPYIRQPDFQFFDPDLFSRSADELLGQRGRRCVSEAIAAHRHGLYLTAANMLGAASEAAWFAVGELLRDRDAKLARELDDDGTVHVIRLAADQLEQMTKRQRSTIADLRVHAAYLRDLRNYGLHPRATSDDDRELAFTEQGSALLLMESRRYFARLREVVVAAGLLPTAAS